MNEQTRTSTRILVAFGIGILIFVVCLLAVWRSWRFLPEFAFDLGVTRCKMEDIDAAISQYKEKTGGLPRSLGELIPANPHLFNGKDGNIIDAWGRPFLYSVEGDTYVMKSLGRDGKPGGVGLDCDLTNTDRFPPGSGVTLGQFYTQPPAPTAVMASTTCGILAFFLSLLTVKPYNLRREGIAGLLLKIGLTAVGAVVVSFIISFYYLMISGH
jgi:hypothetical protein